MPISAVTLKMLMDAGLSGDALVDVVASIDADHTEKPRSSSAERQARYRDRQRNKSDVTRDVTRDVTNNVTCDVTNNVTRDVTDQTAKERSPQTPLKEKPSLKEKPPKGGQKKRGSRLFEDWSLPNEYRDWALSQGFPASALEAEAARFRDYWISKPGKDGVKADWLATWRNWIRNADRFSMVRHPQAPPQPAPVDDYVQLLNFNQASRSAVISKLQLWLSGQIREWRYTPAWSDDHPPGHPDCVIPADLIEEAKRLAEADFPKQRAG